MADQPKPEAATPAAPAAPPAPKGPPQAPSTPWDSDTTRLIRENFAGDVLECATQLGQDYLVAAPKAAVPILDLLKRECGFDYLVDVTAVDYPKRPERFDLVYVLYSFSRNQRVRVKTRIADGFRPPSAVGVHLTANWLEREVFDMFGIEFDGHPDLRRILMPDDWQGYPLRKDYSILQQDAAWVREHVGIESGQ